MICACKYGGVKSEYVSEMKQRVLIEFLTAEYVPLIGILRRTKVYGQVCVDINTFRYWAVRAGDGKIEQVSLNPSLKNGTGSHELERAKLTGIVWSKHDFEEFALTWSSLAFDMRKPYCTPV